MADLGQIDVRIGADTKRLEQGLQKSKGELKEFEGKVSTGAAKMALFTGAAIAGAAALRGLGQFIASSVRLSADLAETQSKFNTVFDASSAKVDKLASSFGILSKGEAQGFLATTGAILRGAGLAGEEVDNLAEQVGVLARDFSSFNNVPVAETFNAINAAITGEREQLKRLGIVLNEAEVQQRALADSGKRAAKELTQQEKAVATLALITQKATVQVGDYTKTQNSAANQAKQLETNVMNLQEAFAEGLEPALRQSLGLINQFASNKGIVSGVKQIGDVIGDLGTGLLLAFKGLPELINVFQQSLSQAYPFLRTTQITVEGIVAALYALPGIGNILTAGAIQNAQSVAEDFRNKTKPLTSRQVPQFSPSASTGGSTSGSGGSADPTRKLTLANTLELIDAENRYQAGLGVSQSNAAALTKELVDTVTNQEIAAGLAELTGENMANVSNAVRDLDIDPFLESLGEVKVVTDEWGDRFNKIFNESINPTLLVVDAITESVGILIDVTASWEEKLKEVAKVARQVVKELAAAAIKAAILASIKLVLGGNLLALADLRNASFRLGSAAAGEELSAINAGLDASLSVNKGVPLKSTPKAQLTASLGIDQIHFALERYKSENFLA